MPHLGDTNLLLRSAQNGHPMQAQARQTIRDVLAQGEEVFLVRQNLVELPRIEDAGVEDRRRHS